MFIDCAWDMCGVLSALNSIIHFWSSSKAVLKTSFSFWLKKSRWDTEPWFVVMLDQTSSLSLSYFANNCLRCLFLTLNEPESVLCV